MAEPTCANHRILLVEDNLDARAGLAALLSLEGYEVLEAAHGQEALGHLATQPNVCLILLDLWMPTMNGITFRERQLADPTIAAIPVIAISADAAAMRRVQAMGVADALTKPIDIGRLLALIGERC